VITTLSESPAALANGSLDTPNPQLSIVSLQISPIKITTEKRKRTALMRILADVTHFPNISNKGITHE
jgi:hypothetical protein